MRNIKMNKKGAEFTIGMLIAIVLGVLVLAVIALGFISGWNNLWDKFNVFGGGKSTLSSASQACQVACGSNNAAGFCSEAKTLKGLSTDQLLSLKKVSDADLINKWEAVKAAKAKTPPVQGDIAAAENAYNDAKKVFEDKASENGLKELKKETSVSCTELVTAKLTPVCEEIRC